MERVLFVVPDLGLTGSSRQVSLLAPVLRRQGWDIHVINLGGGGLFASALERDGVPIRWLRKKRSLDPRPWLELRRLIDEIGPRIVHAWRRPALQVASPVVRWLGGPRLVASDIPGEMSYRWADRWMLQKAAVVVASTTTERTKLVEAGITAERSTTIPLAVGSSKDVDRQAILQELRIPANSRLVLTAGTLELERGFREAIWGFEILKHVYPDIWLVIVGDGPSRRDLEDFAQTVSQGDNRIRFAGVRDDVPNLLSLADVTWVLGKQGGRNATIEAQAAGCPIVARDRPELRELIGSELSDYLIPSADRHELTRRTRQILDDPEVGRRIKEFGQSRVQEFGAKRVAELWSELYKRYAGHS
jgi:glycosyltransferase involved in cell wall biosynthesis